MSHEEALNKLNEVTLEAVQKALEKKDAEKKELQNEYLKEIAQAFHSGLKG